MIDRLFDGSLMPHGHCLLWRPDLLLLHVGGDLLTFIAYSAIPFFLIYAVKKREDLKFDWIWLMLAAFIGFCGISHLIGVINIWHGYYFLEGIAKFATGIISLITAFMLWRLMPVILSVPSTSILSKRNEELSLARSELEKVNKSLEERIQKRTEELEKIASTDSLTGLNNRRSIIDIAEQERERSIRYKHSFSILIIDIDHFKQVNDNHGHQTGDQILSNFARELEKTLRRSDHAGRYGGEEFLLVLPETNQNHATDLANRICKKIEAKNFSIDTTITCSIGVALMQRDESLEELIKYADEALFKAKNQGRNCAVSRKKK